MKIVHIAYLVVLLAAAVIGVYQWKHPRQDRAVKMLGLPLLAAFVSEATALYTNIYFHTNTAAYAFFIYMELVLVCLYFNYSVPVLQRYAIGYLLATVGILWAVVNLILFQPWGLSPTYFVFFKCLMIVGLSMFASYRQMLLPVVTIPLHARIHFMIPLIMNFYWVGNFVSKGIYDHIVDDTDFADEWIHFSLLTVNIMSYAAYGTVLIFHSYSENSKTKKIR